MTEPELKFSDVLAQKRTDLAAQRTVMAAARSMMAWVRTGLSLIGFGFTIYRFLESLTEEGIQLTMRPHGPRESVSFSLVSVRYRSCWEASTT